MKHIVTTCCLLILILFCPKLYGQSIQSDSIYAIGVDLYNQGRYEDALKEFEISNKLDHEELDSLSPRRDYSASWLASCYYKLGNSEEARKLDYGYKSTPVDRRETIVSDSLCGEAMAKMQKKRFFAALSDLNEVSIIEHQICDKDSYYHIGTYSAKAQCFMAMNKIDSALSCMNEVYRLEKIYFNENDTLFLGTLDFLFNLSFNAQDFKKAKAYNDKAYEVIKANYMDTHIGFATTKLRILYLHLINSEWEKAHKALLDYLETLKHCCLNNKTYYLGSLTNIRNDLQLCSLKDDVKIVDKAIANYDLQKDVNDNLFILLMKYSTSMGSNDFKSAGKYEKQISRILNKQPKSEFRDIRACFMCMKTLRLFSLGDNKKGQNIYNQMHKDSLDMYLQKGSPYRMVYMEAKAVVNMYLENYVDAIEAYEEAIHVYPMFTKQNPNAYSTLIELCFMVENYSKALDIVKDAVTDYEQIAQSGSFRIEKDTMEVRKVIDMVQKEIDINHFMPDTVNYALREIKCQYLQLMSRLLTNVEFYQLDVDYLACIKYYANNLMKIDKYYEAQEVLNNYLSDLRDYYQNIDLDSDDIDALIDKALVSDNIHDALEFRRKCYEKGDPSGAEAYLEYADYLKTNKPDKDKEYEKAMFDYYKFTNNNEAISNYIIDLIDKQGENSIDYDTYETLITSLSDNYELSQKYLKKYLNKAYTQRDKNKIKKLIDRIERNYFSQQDNTGLYSFYQNELWPSLDVFSTDDYLYFFFNSIYALDYEEKTSGFIDIITEEMQRKPDVFADVTIKACVEHAIAAVLSNGKEAEMAQKYMRSACEKVKNDKVLEPLFAYGLYNTMYKGDYSYDYYSNEIDKTDSLFYIGHDIIIKAMSNNDLKNTDEMADLANMQVTILPYTKEPLKYIDYYKSLLEYYTSIDKYDTHHILNRDCDLPLTLDFLYDAPLTKSFFFLDQGHMVEKLFYMNHLYPQEAGTMALNIVHKEYDNLSTSMYVNSLRTHQSDELINKTSKYAYKFQTDSLKIYAYNTALYCKGLQLRSNYAIQAMIRKSGHQSALRKFREWQYTNNLMITAQESQLDSLKKRAKSLEDELYSLSKYFGDYKKTLSVSWEDVQQKLNEDDIAIEFTYVYNDYEDKYIDENGHITDDNSVINSYYACIVKKNMTIPEIVFIAYDDSISTAIDVYGNTTMTRRIIDPLKHYLEGVKNIYFSPIGKINQLAIESLLSDDSTNYLSNTYNIYRLSSTRELVTHAQSFKGKDAAVYGGLKYNSSVETMEEEAKKYPEVKNRDISILNMDDIRGSIKGIKYLEGTKTEAEEITATINAVNDTLLYAKSYIGSEGTETSFKALNEKGKRIIHIATHGFYYSEDADKKNPTKDKNNVLSKEDKALMRSGLLFAGAENKYFGDDIPKNIDDGILLAQEISNTDLSGLDLVVLSACQTAQGYISSEGVFGLQRGFKIAGANSILMSLWKVNDDATCLLMTEFYKNWIGNSMTKHDALEEAKKTVRSNNEKGWDDPQYWAAFILLDGLD